MQHLRILSIYKFVNLKSDLLINYFTVTFELIQVLKL